MNTVGERLRYLIDKQGISLKKFCENNEIHYSGLSSMISNDRELGMKVLTQLKKAIPNLDSEWLLFGTDREKVAIYDNTGDIQELKEPVTVYPNIDPGAEALLKYLELDVIQEKIKMILKK